MAVVSFNEEVDGRRVRAEIDVAEANAYRSTVRTLLLSDAGQFPTEKDGAPLSLAEVSHWMVRRTLYPDLMGGARGGWVEIGKERFDLPDLPIEAFEDIPFMLLYQWEKETYRLNPDWLPQEQPAKKKVLLNGLEGLSSSTATAKKTKTAYRKRSG